MDAQTALIAYTVVAYLGMLAVYILEGDGLDGLLVVFWPVTLAAMAAMLAVILPAEGLKWIVRRCTDGQR